MKRKETAAVAWRHSQYENVAGRRVMTRAGRLVAITSVGEFNIANPVTVKEGDSVTVEYNPDDQFCKVVTS